MNEQEMNKALLQAFLLGMRVSATAEKTSDLSGNTNPKWELLHDVADGKVSIRFDTAEVLAHLPEKRKATLKNYLDRVKPMVKETDQQLAKKILAGIAG